VDAQTTAELIAAHKSGVVDYTCLVRERQVDILPVPISVGNAAQFIPLYLRSFRNKSAGITIKFQDSSPSQGNAGMKYQFSTIYLLDALGRKLTEILDTDYVTSSIDSKQITAPILGNTVPSTEGASGRDGYSSQYVYLLPFSSAFEKVLNTGCAYGSFPFTALEQLQLVPSSTASATAPIVAVQTSKAVITTSYSYAHVICVQGAHQFRTESGGSGQ